MNRLLFSRRSVFVIIFILLSGFLYSSFPAYAEEPLICADDIEKCISSRLQALESLAAYDLPDDHYARYVPAIQAVGADEVQRVAKDYLQPDHLVIAIVGDRKTLEPRIRALDIGSLTPVSIDELCCAGEVIDGRGARPR